MGKLIALIFTLTLSGFIADAQVPMGGGRPGGGNPAR